MRRSGEAVISKGATKTISFSLRVLAFVKSGQREGSGTNARTGVLSGESARPNRKEGGQKVSKANTKKNIDELLRTTEKTREELKKSWKRVEDLDAAIQSAKNDQLRRNQGRKSN